MNPEDGLFYGEFLESAIMVTIGVSTMIYLSWQLSLVGFMVVPCVLGIVVFFGRKIYSRALTDWHTFRMAGCSTLDVIMCVPLA